MVGSGDRVPLYVSVPQARDRLIISCRNLSGPVNSPCRDLLLHFWAVQAGRGLS